jgi:uncharacterized alpha-E superfamily protein
MTLPTDTVQFLPRPAADASKFYVSRGPRPMLARDADSVYWMSRYVERAEHVGRILLISGNLLTDVGHLDEELVDEQWRSILTILQVPGDVPGEGAMRGRVAQFMTFDEENPSSLLNCVSRARENARGVRETISQEMWECLNMLYWSLRGDDARARFEESPDDFFRSVMTGSFLFQGLTDQTLAHDQRWMFTQLGKFLERTAVTSRVLSTKYDILSAAEPLETPIRNIHWMAVLRTCASIEAFRRQHIGDLDPLRVAAFLIMEGNFPRSIRFSVSHAHEMIGRIRGETNPRSIEPAERILGQLKTQLEYAQVEEIVAVGISAYLQKIQDAVADAARAVQSAYFLH